jgi:putative flippase GtrA
MSKPRLQLSHLIRFGVVGSVNSFFAYLVFAFCLRLGCHFSLATLIGSLFGMMTGFKLHGHFVFGNPGRGRFLRFALIFCFVYGVSVGIQEIARLAVNGYVAGAIAAAITIPVSFTLNRNLVFHRT